MKQVLLLSLACSLYRRSPQIRLYINDNFIDEFELTHTIDQEHADKVLMSNNSIENDLHPTMYGFGDRKRNFIMQNSFSKIYEINDTVLYKIKLDIKNDDNNYTNGFMNKTTLIYPTFLTMVPLKIFNDADGYAQKYKFNKKYHRSIQQKKQAYTNPGKKQLIKNFFASHPIGNKWTGKTQSIYFNLYKKHGFYSADKHPIGIKRFGHAGDIKFLYGKYYEDENTRSSNT